MSNLTLEKLSKQDSGVFSKKPSALEVSKRKMRGICTSLSKPSDDYLPAKTIASIESYISASDRILYSEISGIVFSTGSQERGTMASNLDKLMDYVSDPCNNVTDDVRKVTTKLWDHFHLVLYQAENAENIIASHTTEVKDELVEEFSEKVKEMEREYITILGIFAAVIITFTASITFSTSVLENMHKSSIYRILIISLVVGLILVNALCAMFLYVDSFVHKNEKRPMKPFWASNIILLALIVFIIVAWWFGAVEVRNDRIDQTISIRQSTEETE